MAAIPSILAFAGATRAGSFNKKLINLVVAALADAGAAVTLIELRDLPMPLYDGDLERDSGLPENAKRFRELLKVHGGFVIASPEYNSSFSGVLKNAIDWASRPQPNEAPLIAFTGKIAALFAASPGQLGGIRGLLHLRQVLNTVGTLVLAEQLAIPRAAQAFDEHGRLKDEGQAKTLAAVAARLVAVASRLSG